VAVAVLPVERKTRKPKNPGGNPGWEIGKPKNPGRPRKPETPAREIRFSGAGRLALPLPFPQATQPGDCRVNKRVQQPPNNPVHKKPLPIP